MPQPVSFKFVFSSPVHWLAFGFGSGLAAKAPGTFGTLVAVPFFWMLADLSVPLYLLVCGLVCLFGIWLCDVTAKAMKVHDHPGIVWDEIAGYLITMIGFAASWQNILIGFLLFRFFDIIKPYPIRWIDQKVSGGFGIMLDDIIAGVFAWCCLYGINYLWL